MFNFSENEKHLPAPELWEAPKRAGDKNCLLEAEDEEP